VLPRILHSHRQIVVLVLHLLLIPLGFFTAFLLRFELEVPEEYLAIFAVSLVYLVPLRLISFAVFGLYHGWWRHVGMQDLVDLVKAVTLSTALFLGALFLTQEMAAFPRSVLVLDWVLAIFIFGGIRFAVRGAREARTGWSGVERRGIPALIIGAGNGGDRLLRQVRQGGVGIRPVGLVDDDPAKRRMRLHGIPVVGTTAELEDLVIRTQVKLLVIAVPSASREEMQRLVDRCLRTGVEFRIVPPLHELIDGRARMGELRKVEIEDLLGRDAVQLDVYAMREDLAGRVVLVTGGAGSIGSELARQIAGLSPASLLLLDQAESSLYFVDLGIRKSHPELEVIPIIADVTDRTAVEAVFAAHRPDYVFHAAAYKHVPLMERHPAEAVRNNVFGTMNVAQAAVKFEARKFVLISTDKAVRPSSVMGATKRVAERIVLGWPEFRRSTTDFRAVRFGNVLGSHGSVIPLFKQQIEAGEPLTITHAEVTRYFMTIPEAVQLVLRAAALPEASGCICMLEMGEPVRIVTLAENLIRLSGLQPYRDVPIIFTGLRPGEKLHEELMSQVEETVPTSLEKVRVVQTDESDGPALLRRLDRLATSMTVGGRDDVLAALCSLVPECISPLRERGSRGVPALEQHRSTEGAEARAARPGSVDR
jgi:FlaA1/EpsC-like NDP-sugar epimerase